VQEGEVPPADLQAAIAASFKTQHQERAVSRAAQRRCSPGDGPRQGGAPTAPHGVLGPARRRRRQAVRLVLREHSRHLLATTMTTSFSYFW
jgi:hypothetical protein